MRVENVAMAYGPRQVLRNVSFEVPAGKSLAIMGASGSGKSTLLSIVAGIALPTSGRVAGPDKEDIQWVLQSAPVLPRRNVLDNVMLGPLTQGASLEVAHLRASRSIRDLAISQLSRTRLNRLSGGERQRVALCRALASESELILADEPTASLDYVAKDRVLDALHRAMRLDRRIIIATHDADVARACNEILYLREGVLVAA